MNSHSKANDLARQHGLTRKTQSVSRDKNGAYLIIVEEVAGLVFEDDTATSRERVEVNYFMFKDPGIDKVNPILEEVKTIATYRFLGMDNEALSAQTTPTTTKAKVKEPIALVPEEEEDEDEAAIEEAPKATKKKATKAAAPAKARSKATDKKPPVQMDEGEELGSEDEELEDIADEAPKGILYNKADREHASHLRTIIVKRLGKDWKNDKDKTAIVKSLVAQVADKHEVVSESGELLGSFIKFADKFLEKAIA